MSLGSPLSPKQRVIWGLKLKGLSPREIAERIKSSRQYVHQVGHLAEAKISSTLLEVAQSANLRVKTVDSKNGVLVAYDPALTSNVVITYTNRNGVRIWHWYERIEEIKDLSYIDEVREYLLSEADERGIELTPEEKEKHPAKLASIIFSTLIPGLKS